MSFFHPAKIALILAITSGLGSFQSAAAANKAKVSLISSVSSAAPGQPFDVGLKFTIAEKWHIYWKNAGESGMAPIVEWKLPEGFTVSELRFPVPKRHEQSGIYTHILENEPILLATVTPPTTLKTGEKIKIDADIKWLICLEQCLQEQQSVTLSLDVAAADQIKPANEDEFKRARRKLPVSQNEAKHVTLSTAVTSGKLAPGAKLELELTVKIKPGFHIQSNKPLVEGLVAADIFMDKIPGMFFDPARFPDPKIRDMPGIGRLSEFADEVKIRIPSEADTDLPAPSYKLGGVFLYQACNEKGICFPPEGVEWYLDVPVSRADAGMPDATRAAGATQTPTLTDAAKSKPDADAAPVEKDASTPVESGQQASTGASGGESTRNRIDKLLKTLGLPGLLAGCFLYGLFLNATPCVLPLLSIKVLGFVQQAHESRRRTLALGLAFGAGVMLFYIVLGFLAAAGKNVLQYPVAVIALGAVVTAMALSMLGVFSLQAPAAAVRLDDKLQKEGIVSSFGKGALAPVLGLACTGPFLAGAFGLATKQPPNIAVIAFLLMGLGMASPYMVLGANPNWLSFLPKPGPWMITFERVMGFLLLGMLINLVHPLVTQIGAEGLEWTLAFFVAIAFACWIWGQMNALMPSATQWRYRGAALAIIAVSGFVIYGGLFPLDAAIARQRKALAVANTPATTNDWSDHVPFKPWSVDEVRRTVLSGKPVFVDFTSASCTTCKVNKLVAINKSEARAKMQALGIVPFQGDFTSGDPAIFEMLQKFGQVGVPLNLIYPAGQPDHPILLDTTLSLKYLLEKLDESAAR